MESLIFPTGRTIFRDKAYSQEFLELTLAEIREKAAFTGMIKSDSRDFQGILFFLKGRPYAAGGVGGLRPVSQTIREFFEELRTHGRGHTTISLYEIDPVLFKCLLVFLQKEPTIKASARLLNYDDILGEIRESESGAVIILKKDGKMNFFFFLKGEPVKAHFVGEAEDGPGDAASLLDKLVLYSYPDDMVPVDVFIYRDISTIHAPDAEDISDAELVEMLVSTGGQEEPPSSFVVVTILGEGEKKLTISLPCVIGRREGDIILQDGMVSGRHAALRESGGKLVIEDLNSTNGTFVNGLEIKARELVEGDVITVGETRIQLENISIPGD